MGVTAGPSPQCWVVLGAAAQRGHWAEAQGCGSGPLDLWGSQSWDPLVGRHAERYGPRRAQELPQGLRTHCCGG